MADEPQKLSEEQERWEAWLATDLREFLGPLAQSARISLTDALLYMILQHLAQITEAGLVVKVIARHEHPPDDMQAGEDWKK